MLSAQVSPGGGAKSEISRHEEVFRREFPENAFVPLTRAFSPGDDQTWSVYPMGIPALLFVFFGIALADTTERGVSTMTDHDALQGRWTLNSGERHGKGFSDELLKRVTLEFEGVRLSTKNGDHVSNASFKLHSDASPKGIDLDMDGNIGRGIYKLEGDTLTILHGEVGDDRPLSFDPKQMPRATLLVLKRIPPATSEPVR
jgi:uncharacterized protein (TIGR03067 family)